ncbi:hypothetical protein KI440_01800 [Candidatus Saccharibacteria bacterium TM7i]|nr:hypothetical protein KI440_01800 [Candidatus Saccharibacteria bacterium TM7i]
MERHATSPEGLKYINYDFDFMVSDSAPGVNTVFRRAALMHLKEEGESLNPTFKYGEMTYSGKVNGYFAIYAEAQQVYSWAEAEARQEVLFDKIVTSLGRLGLTLLNRDYSDHDGDMTLVDTEGSRVAILGSRGACGGNDDPLNGVVRYWGVNAFPEVDLTKAV